MSALVFAGMLELAVGMMEAKRIADSDSSAPIEVPPEFNAFFDDNEVRSVVISPSISTHPPTHPTTHPPTHQPTHSDSDSDSDTKEHVCIYGSRWEYSSEV